MRARSFLAALGCAALAVPTAPAVAKPTPTAMVLEFTGYVWLGCLNCNGEAGFDTDAYVVSPAGLTYSSFDSSGAEDTTPDPCPVLLEYYGTFTAGDITGDLRWIRSLNEIVLIADNVSGGDFMHGSGTGRAHVLTDPASMAIGACGDTNHRYLVEGSLTLRF